MAANHRGHRMGCRGPFSNDDDDADERPRGAKASSEAGQRDRTKMETDSTCSRAVPWRSLCRIALAALPEVHAYVNDLKRTCARALPRQSLSVAVERGSLKVVLRVASHDCLNANTFGMNLTFIRLLAFRVRSYMQHSRRSLTYPRLPDGHACTNPAALLGSRHDSPAPECRPARSSGGRVRQRCRRCDDAGRRHDG